MASEKIVEKAFINAGKTHGIVIWRIESLKLKQIRTEDQGNVKCL